MVRSSILLLLLLLSKPANFVAMKILISGTKNAYTTLRPQDIVYFKLPQQSDGTVKALGLFTVEGGRNVVKPLCKIDEEDEEYYVDQSQESLSADSLNKQGSILRIVSADRKGRDAFIIEEYVDDDVSIPIRPSNSLKPATSSEQTDTSIWKELQARLSSRLDNPALPATESAQPSNAGAVEMTDVLEARLQVATLRLELLETKFKLQQERKTDKNQFASVTDPLQLSPRPYSHAVKVNGMIFLSGCIGISPETKKLVDGGATAELRCAVETMKRILDASKSSLNRVCKVTLLLKDMKDYDAVNCVYKEYFSGEILPARTTAAVSDLPFGASVEIEAIAFAND